MEMVLQEDGPSAAIERLVLRLRVSTDNATLLLIVHKWNELRFTDNYLQSLEYRQATMDIVEKPKHDHATTRCKICSRKEVCQNAGCGHYFCNQCYLEKLNAQVDEDDIHLSCPFYGCSKYMPPSFIKSRLHSSEELRKYDAALKRHYQDCRQAAIAVNREQGNQEAIAVNREQGNQEAITVNREQGNQEAIAVNREQRNQEAIAVNREQRNQEAIAVNREQGNQEVIAVNREQRNQEAIEVARGELERRKKRQRWIWGSIAAIITLGSAALAWSYIPAAKPLSEVSPLKDEC